MCIVGRPHASKRECTRTSSWSAGTRFSEADSETDRCYRVQRNEKETLLSNRHIDHKVDMSLTSDTDDVFSPTSRNDAPENDATEIEAVQETDVDIEEKSVERQLSGLINTNDALDAFTVPAKQQNSRPPPLEKLSTHNLQTGVKWLQPREPLMEAMGTVREETNSAGLTGFESKGKKNRPVDVVFIAVHGIGASEENLQQCKNALRRNIRALRQYWFWEFDFESHVIMLDWKSGLLPLQGLCFERLCAGNTSPGRSPINSTSPFFQGLAGLFSRPTRQSDNQYTNGFFGTVQRGRRNASQQNVKSESFMEVKVSPPMSNGSGSTELDRAQSNSDDPGPGGRIFPHGVTDLANPRKLMSNNVADLLCFMTPRLGDQLVASVRSQLETCMADLQKDERFRHSKIVTIGHSLGGIILYELLTQKPLRPGATPPPPLTFKPESLFLWGCPLSAFTLLSEAGDLKTAQDLYPVMGDNSLKDSVAASNVPLKLPAGVRVYNVFHPSDPIAYRLEPLYYKHLQVETPDPVRLPHWRNNSAKEYLYWADDLSRTTKAVTNYARDVRSRVEAGIYSTLFKRNEIEHALLDAPRYKYHRRECCWQRTLPDVRYGLHDRVVKLGCSARSWPQSTASPSHPVVRRKPVPQSAADLLKRFELDDNEIEELQVALTATIEYPRRSTKVTFTRTETEVDKYLEAKENSDENGVFKTTSRDDVLEVLGESEDPRGLELPVRLDFRLQEEVEEYYISYWAAFLSHYSYWDSRDAVFFMLKQSLDFHPKLPYSDALKIYDVIRAKKNRNSRLNHRQAGADPTYLSPETAT